MAFRAACRPAIRSSKPRISSPITSRAASTSAEGSSSSLRNATSAVATITAGTLLVIYYSDSRSAIHRYGIMPALRATLDPETAHRFAVRALGSGLAPKDMVQDQASLSAEIWGRKLSSPVGLAAGFDKDGEAIDGLFGLGFSWVEIGSVTPQPQPGNPRPRFFHLLDDSAVINRYGFPSVGFPLVLSRLRSHLFNTPQKNHILAVNLGKNKFSAPDSIDDFLAGVRTFGPLADVLVINVSSPNTPGLRGLQSRGMLEELLTEVVKARDALASREDLASKWPKPKIVVKIAPDLEFEEIEDIAAAVRESNVDGVIVSNTTVQRPDHLKSAEREEMGGLSGPPLRPFALQALRRLRSLLPASVPIIGCGGITTGADALEFARAGATTVQIYTSFGYEGVGAPRRLKDEIAAELQKAGTTWRDASRDAVEKHASVEPEKPKEDLDLLAKESLDLKLMLDNLEPEFEGQGVLGLVEADQVLDAAPTGNVGMAGEHDERQLLDNVAPAILEALPHSEEGIDVQEGRLSDGSASTDVELRGDSGSI